ncbi:hypothetical protein Hypma_008223 [Hypsizygus marmoreus]|uniref:Uncharacterized protein n=1 Tax=Hypsizygus marmoreus TaxID=39966 RepID=A0A369K130_HYPMA|nr:hypothetical protein Hypma_008223 [Hypsizygus marmoreus]
MESASTNFSYSAGGIAFTGTSFALYRWGRNRLPNAQMQDLDAVFVHTRQLYVKSDEEGLLPAHFKATVEQKLAELERSQEELRERTYRAITIFQQSLAAIQGLSTQIISLQDNVKELRASIVTTSMEIRRQREPHQFQNNIPASDISPPLPNMPHSGSVNTSGPNYELTMPLPTYSQSSSSEETLVPSIPAMTVHVPCQPTALDASHPCAPAEFTLLWAIRLVGSRSWRAGFRSEDPPTDIETGPRGTSISAS